MSHIERLQRRIAELQRQWDDLSQKIDILRQDMTHETRSDEKLRLRHVIAGLEAERDRIDKELKIIEDQPITHPPEPLLPKEPSEFPYDVFISYNSTDLPWVRSELLPRLEKAGLRVCIDFRDFDAGAPRPTEVERAILTSRKTVLVLTPSYLSSEWDEFGNLMLQALDPASRQRRLIPVLKEKCDLPLRLNFLWPVDFIKPVDRSLSWVQLLTTLGAPSI